MTLPSGTPSHIRPYFVNTCMESGWTALHFACFNRHSKIARFIIENSGRMNIDLNAQTSNSRSTAFHFACLYDCNLDLVKMFLQNFAGMRINLNSKDSQGRTAYHNACISNSKKISKIIQNHAYGYHGSVDLAAKDNYSKTGWDYWMENFDQSAYM